MCFLLLFLYLNVILYHCADTYVASITGSQGIHKGITLKAGNQKFVEEIKQELTNDNDDYLESSPLTPSPPHPPFRGIQNDWRRFLSYNNTTNTTDPSSPQKERATKDGEGSSCSLELNTATSHEKISIDIDARKSMKQATPGLQTSTFGRSVDTATTRTRQKKGHKPRNPKSRDLLKSLLKDPWVGRAHVSGATTRPPAPQRPHVHTSSALAPERPQVRARPALALALSREIVPDSRELDMWPARGAHIETMRNKNRLCQRNVLIPEGPKYDSQGRVYLAAYAPRGPRADYAHTRPRLFVLPRCCNCCRKSVLGCE